jgi:hypothetical protein
MHPNAAQAASTGLQAQAHRQPQDWARRRQGSRAIRHAAIRLAAIGAERQVIGGNEPLIRSQPMLPIGRRRSARHRRRAVAAPVMPFVSRP